MRREDSRTSKSTSKSAEEMRTSAGRWMTIAQMSSSLRRWVISSTFPRLPFTSMIRSPSSRLFCGLLAFQRWTGPAWIATTMADSLSITSTAIPSSRCVGPRGGGFTAPICGEDISPSGMRLSRSSRGCSSDGSSARSAAVTAAAATATATAAPAAEEGEPGGLRSARSSSQTLQASSSCSRAYAFPPAACPPWGFGACGASGACGLPTSSSPLSLKHGLVHEQSMGLPA
mmetsp:Transcript_28436/g.91526  ORF Transcript_28436/g.91526 Transcript_28436/m.91526 type:complete len:230 (+) Transcript_28436:416-1105(+)